MAAGLTIRRVEYLQHVVNLEKYTTAPLVRPSPLLDPTFVSKHLEALHASLLEHQFATIHLQSQTRSRPNTMPRLTCIFCRS